ncbi:MAG: copper chaperone PCu(A)C [Ilumatobacter sp.]|nr:MAG: copper chaperone PCu(A)C [Ilumatobacter sp.]
MGRCAAIGNSAGPTDDREFMHSIPRPRFALRSVALVAVAALSLAACGGDDAASEPAETEASVGVEMSIADAWSRQPAAGQSVSAAYGILSNPGDVDVTVVSASSPISTQVELHETLVDDDGMMMMVEREQGFVVPAGGEFVFEPGGPHVMFLDIDAASYPDEVEVTLEFDGAESLTFMAEVRAIDGGMGMGHGDG